jgi:serine/threonine protein kinase
VARPNGFSCAIFRIRARTSGATGGHPSFVASQRNELLFLTLTEALPGTVLDGKYRLEEKIVAGGFGTVYRASHLLLHRPVAVKLLKPSGGDLLSNMERFRQEGAAACLLVHPNAVSVVDFGVSAGAVAYPVMELLEGRSLDGPGGGTRWCWSNQPPSIVGIAKDYVDAGADARGAQDGHESSHHIAI